LSDTLERKVIFRQLLGKSSAFSHRTCEIVLRKVKVHILEMEDVLFHHDSAVMMPQSPAGKSSQDGAEDDVVDPLDIVISADQEEVTGVKALALVFKQFEFDPEKRIIVAGHTDTSGRADYNFKLSDLRAQNVLYLLTGEREEESDHRKWSEVSYKKHKVEDYQQILKYFSTSPKRKWPCDPGDINNRWNKNTRDATEQFINYYNKDYVDKQDPKPAYLSPDLITAIDRDPQHRWPIELWDAVFNLYSEEISDILDITQAELDNRRRLLLVDDSKWVDPEKKFVGCGESFPIDDAEKSNYRSQSNRRVVILFFDKDEHGRDEAPLMDCPPDRTKVHKEEDCPLWHGFHFMPLYIDPLDLYAVVYHLEFKYHNRVENKTVSVPDGLIIKAFENDTEELPTHTKWKKGIYYVKVQFRTPVDDGSHKSLHFEFQAPNQWVYTEKKGSPPEIRTDLPDRIKKLPWITRHHYYDLPVYWWSRNYWTRYDGNWNKGEDYEKVFKEKLKLKPVGDKETEPSKPLTFCLDDFVLTNNTFVPISQPAGSHEAAILDHEFAVFNPDKGNHKSYFTKDGIKIEAGFPYVRIPIPERRLGGILLMHKTTPKPLYKLFAIFEDRLPATHDLRGHRAAVYEHKDKCILVKRFQQRHQRDYDNIGRFDAYLLRDQDVNAKGEEISYIFNYFRWHFERKTPTPKPPPNNPSPPLKTIEDVVPTAKWPEWKDEAITNMTGIWNDTANNQLASLYHENGDKKYRIFVRYHIEEVPKGEHETLVYVHMKKTAKYKSGRSNMGRDDGNIKANETKPHPTTKRFTAAHEFGHATSLDDDYIERTNYCSYRRLGFVDFKPGGPFCLDPKAMMKANIYIRSRYYWHFATWMHREFVKAQKTEFSVIKKNNQDFKLPYNPTNPSDPRDMAKYSKNYINYPQNIRRDTFNQKSTKTHKGKFHLYLYPLGKDRYSQGGLYGANNFTAIMVVIVNLYFESWVGNPDVDAIKTRLSKINTDIYDKFRKNNGIKICGTKPFEETFVQVVPRFLVKHYASDYESVFAVDQAKFTTRHARALKLPTGTKHLNVKIVSGSTSFDPTPDPPKLSLKNNNSEWAKFWRYFSQTLGLSYGATLNKDNFSVGNFVPGGVVKNL
jgi:outer membrane protein OmpA-like peptidoglycan-associated protein